MLEGEVIEEALAPTLQAQRHGEEGNLLPSPNGQRRDELAADGELQSRLGKIVVLELPGVVGWCDVRNNLPDHVWEVVHFLKLCAEVCCLCRVDASSSVNPTILVVEVAPEHRNERIL